MAASKRIPPGSPQITSSGAAVLARPAAKSVWILDRWRDLLLFVATPILILPAFWSANRFWSIEDIALFVAAFGALGHHFPGMLRAYGDRALFQRFKLRFIFAPLFLVTVCVFSTFQDLSGVLLVAALWGVWHGMMQTYGFLRIYDAKKGHVEPLTSGLDRAMCFAWFGAGLLLSPTRMFDVLRIFFFEIGAPALPGVLFGYLRTFWIGATAAITLAFAANLIWRWSQGRAPSGVKLLLMVTSFGFWWYSCMNVANLLVGVALFEVFHDVQYLAIVWVFNRSRVDKDGSSAGLMRFLFRNSGALAGVYVGLVFAYGSLAIVARGLSTEILKDVFTGVLIASALLHFYYDGFIWKVREKSTSQALGLKGGKEISNNRQIPMWLQHGLKWGLFAGLVGWLCVIEIQAKATPAERAQTIVEALPFSADAHEHLGRALADTPDQIEPAVRHFERALEIDPEHAPAHLNLGQLYGAQGDTEREWHHLQKAATLRPDLAEVHDSLGVAMTARGQLDEALRSHRRALELNPRLASAHNHLGMALAARGDSAAAIQHLERALRLEPELEGLRLNYGNTLAGERRWLEAVDQYRLALETSPNDAGALSNLAWILATAPDDSARDGSEAVRLANRACELTGYRDPAYLNVLAAAYAESGQLTSAVATARQAAGLAATRGQQALAAALAQRLELYRAGRPYRQPDDR